MSTAAPARPAAPLGVSLTHRQIVMILVGLMSGMFLAALDQTIVSTSIRTIADDLHGLSVQAWVTTAYLITSTISTPLYGKLSDIYGRRPFFLAAISIFVVGSALCAFSTSMYMLAAFRALQGIGAGGLFSLALTTIGDIVPARERAKYQGYFLAVFGTSSVLGPVIGGFFAGQDQLLWITGWKWVFLINVPIGVASLLIVNRVLHIPHRRRDHRIDWVGAIALVVALVPLLTVAEQGRQWGWASGRSVAAYVVGAIGVACFLAVERRMGDEALLPLRLFRNRTFSISGVSNLIVGMGMFGGIASIPLYLQIVKGKSPTEAGLLTVPLVLGIMVGSIISGQVVAKTGRYKIFPVVGAALLVTGLLLMHSVGVDTPLWQTDIYMAVFGLGLGFNMQTLVLAVQNAVPPTDIGVATSSATFFRQMGGTLGTAVFLSVLFSTVGDRISEALRTIAPTAGFQAALRDPQVLADPANRSFIQQLSQARAGGTTGAATSGALQDSSFINQLDPRLARPFLVGFSEAMDGVFLLGAAVLLVGFFVVIFLPELPLRRESAMQARQAQAEGLVGVDVEEHDSPESSLVPVGVAAGGGEPEPTAPTGTGGHLPLAEQPPGRYRGRHAGQPHS